MQTAIAVAACSSQQAQLDPPPVATVQQGLAGGTLDNAHASVGPVEAGVCTGTLIGRRTVLTAAHCVLDHPSDLQFCAGPNGQTQVCRSGAGTPHPDYDPGWSGVDQDDDVGVIRLFADFPTINPSFISTGINYQPVAGHSTTVVGISGTDRNNPTLGAGMRRSGLVPISSVDPGQFSTQGSVAVVRGDSGGPAFRDDWVGGVRVDCQIGVTSTESGSDVSTFTRVDQKFDWIYTTANDPTVRGCHNSCRPAGSGCTTNGDCCSAACVCVFACGSLGVSACQ